MDKNIIYKYLNQNATESEVEQVYRWIDASPENREEFILYKKAWALSAKSSANPDNAWEKLFNLWFGKGKIALINFKLIKYAALLAIVFCTGLLVQYTLSKKYEIGLAYTNETKIKVPMGQMTNIELPDGTTVSLNSGSQLTYSGDFNKGKRIVNLEGEAFFDVTKDRKHQFTVKTKTLDLRVFGTTFNIAAYPEESIVTTTLVSGSLNLQNKNGKELALLKPGQTAIYNINELNTSIVNVDSNLYTSWKDGLINFRNEKLKDIAVKLQRWYNVEIIINNPSVGEQPYFGTIMKNKPIDQILEVFRLTSELKYRIVSRPDKPTLIYWD